MYLHIGNDYIIDTKNVIGIFNIETVEKKESDKIIKTCNDKGKSVVLYKKDNEFVEYITNISTATLAKRINMFSNKNNI